jgi:hypothetical protein
MAACPSRARHGVVKNLERQVEQSGVAASKKDSCAQARQANEGGNQSGK